MSNEDDIIELDVFSCIWFFFLLLLLFEVIYSAHSFITLVTGERVSVRDRNVHLPSRRDSEQRLYVICFP